MIVIGIDPGPEKSAYVFFNGERPTAADTVDNNVLLSRLEEWRAVDASDDIRRVLVCEQVSMGGMIAGPSVFETCFWTGRFVEMWSPRRWDRLKRIDVKKHLIHSVRGNDTIVREALVERFGPGVERAIGKKAVPGPLFGIAGHEWAALAVAVSWFDLNGHKPEDVRPGVPPMF